MARLYFIRHGETDWNKLRLVQGLIDVPLNATGQEQARQLAQRLQAEKLHHIYTSPQKRAYETAEIVAQYHPHVPFTWRRDLAENYMGRLQGMHLDDVRAQYAETDWNREDFRQQVGAESPAYYHRHFSRYLPALLWQHPHQNLLISTHGGKLKTILHAIFGAAHTAGANKARKYIKAIHPRNCSLTIVEWAWEEERPPILELYADDTHLQELRPSA